MLCSSSSVVRSAGARRSGVLIPKTRRCLLVKGLPETGSSFTANVLSQLAEVAPASDAAPSASAAAVAGAAATATAVAATAPPADDGGPFGFLAEAFEAILKGLDGVLEALHVPYSYGFSIILLTILVKVATFPLSKQQVQSTVAMQALQPSVKEIQAKYAGDPETLNLETARLYQEAGVNPLAGCLPTLATIPVFIGLYKALTNAADHGLLEEDFFWIPNLAGPATFAERAAGGGLGWLFPFVDGAPPIGWGAAGAYLVMPLLLVASQYASQQIMQPPNANQDPAAQQSTAILKFLPLMIGWFSLNVPSGLTLYWFTNNIISTAQQVYLRKTTKVEKPRTTTGTEEQVKKVPGSNFQARKSGFSADVIDVEATSVPMSSGSASAPSQAAAPAAPSGPTKGAKFQARKAKEAAAKSASASTEAPVEAQVTSKQE